MSVRLLMIWFDYQFKRLKGMVRFNKDSKSLVNKEPNSDEHMSDTDDKPSTPYT